MSERLAAAETALKAGRTEEGLGHLMAAVDENPARPVGVYRVLCANLLQLGRNEEGARYAGLAVQRHPKDVELLNLHGILLRRLGRLSEALEVLERAIKVDPRPESPHANRANVLLDLGSGPAAEAAFIKLLRKNPRSGEYQRLLGRALRMQGKVDAAVAKFRQALTVEPRLVPAWIDLAGALIELGRLAEAEEALDKGLGIVPGQPKLVEGKVQVMKAAGRSADAEALLNRLLAEHPDAGWLHQQMGVLVSDSDRERANHHLRRAVELDPNALGLRMSLIESLERTRAGDEGAHIEEAYQLLKPLLSSKASFTPGQLKIAFEVLVRVCAFDELERLGSLKELGRTWAESGRHHHGQPLRLGDDAARGRNAGAARRAA